MNHEKRLFLAIMISMVVVFAFQILFPPPPPPKKSENRAGMGDSGPIHAGLSLDSAPTGGREAGSALPVANSVDFNETSVMEVEEPARSIELKLANKTVELYETGGVVGLVQLNDYAATRASGALSPVELVSPASRMPGFFSLALDQDDRSRLTSSRWRSGTDTYRTSLDRVAFSLAPRVAELPGGIELEKAYAWDTRHGMSFTVTVANRSSREVTLATARLVESVGSAPTDRVREGSFLLQIGPSLGVNHPHHQYIDQYIVHGSFSRAGQVEQAVTSLSWWHSIFGAPEAPSDVEWVALENRYFTIALLPQDFKIDPIFTESPADGLRCWILLPSFKLNPGQSREFRFRVFAGPKSTRELARFAPELEKLDGMEPSVLPKKISIARWMVGILTWIHGFVHNWGWSIIILTVLVRLLLYPLSHIQFKSMAKMQNLKPRIEELQAKYAHDQERLQRELMKVYSEAGVNPLGGCLPIIVQMPILIGLFIALQNSIQLRGVPFILWINDLSIPDTVVSIFGLPINPLPVLMCGTMWIQQKLTPMPSADPAQKQMMMIMPFMMTVLFYNFPSGLSLYWVIQNVLSIAQQYLMMRHREVK
jgi:YidC/Oxa1 family membrane protein insertase